MHADRIELQKKVLNNSIQTPVTNNIERNILKKILNKYIYNVCMVKTILMRGVGFEPTQLTLTDLKTVPLDQLGHPRVRSVFTLLIV